MNQDGQERTAAPPRRNVTPKTANVADVDRRCLAAEKIIIESSLVLVVLPKSEEGPPPGGSVSRTSHREVLPTK